MTITLNGTTGITTPALDSVAPFSSADMPAGSVLQVVSATLTSAQTIASQTFTDITGLSVSITPTSASSKIFVLIKVSAGHQAYGHSYIRMLRDSTLIAAGSDASLVQCFSSVAIQEDWATHDHVMFHLDSPSTTSSVTYKAQGRREYTSGALYINRSARNTGLDQSTASNITVMEIAS